jgi:hypothetical protein
MGVGYVKSALFKLFNYYLALHLIFSNLGSITTTKLVMNNQFAHLFSKMVTRIDKSIDYQYSHCTIRFIGNANFTEGWFLKLEYQLRLLPYFQESEPSSWYCTESGICYSWLLNKASTLFEESMILHGNYARSSYI